MKPEVSKLVRAFADTAAAVKLRLKASGFVLPVAHQGGIKFKHCYVKKNVHGWYDISNLHNPKKKYYTGICSHKVAVALAIYMGLDKKAPEQQLLNADHQYLHYYNELRFLRHGLKMAESNNDEVKIDMFNARIEEYAPKFASARLTVSRLLDVAESLLFETK